MKIHQGWRPISGVIHEPRGVTSDVKATYSAALIKIMGFKDHEMNTNMRGLQYHMNGLCISHHCLELYWLSNIKQNKLTPEPHIGNLLPLHYLKGLNTLDPCRDP